MARTANTPAGPAPISNLKRDPFLELDRLLARLSQNILHATAEQERRLQRDEFERTKVRHDIRAARVLLTETEQSAFGIKVHKRKTETQADLAQKKLLIEALLDRVQVLEDLGRQEKVEESDDDEDGEDLLAGIVMPAPVEVSGATNGQEEDAISPLEKTRSKSVSWDMPPQSDEPVQETPSTTTTPALRARGKQSIPPTTQPHPSADTAQTTSSQTSTAAARRSDLFGTGTDRNSLSATATEEAVLENHRAEQEAISGDILRLAKEMRQRSEATAKLLEDDKMVMDRVGDALHVTDTNMESAGRGMNVLARMTEGKGYIGRLILYAVVFGLAVLLVLAFAVVPKLRW